MLASCPAGLLSESVACDATCHLADTRRLPRTIFGYFHAVCAYLRMLYLAVAMCIVDKFDVVVCDQVGACVRGRECVCACVCV
jgi:hypothetical protein